MQTYRQHLRGLGPCLLFMILSGLSGCRPTENPVQTPTRNKIFADFYVRYLAPEKQIRGQVSFWEGISWEILDPVEMTGIVSFENRKMTARRLPGDQVRYSETFLGDYEESLAFRFRNRDGRYLQYELKMTPVRDFFVKGRISKSTGATFGINGGVLNKEESLVFMFISAQQKAAAITIDGPHADVELQIGPDQLQRLSPGPGQLYLVKKQHRTESHPNLELTATVEYYTGSREVWVEE